LKHCQRGGADPGLRCRLTLLEDRVQLTPELAAEGGRVRQNGKAMKGARKR
jgi:hypothetical protein